jgi:hypothetical protein
MSYPPQTKPNTEQRTLALFVTLLGGFALAGVALTQTQSQTPVLGVLIVTLLALLMRFAAR